MVNSAAICLYNRGMTFWEIAPTAIVHGDAQVLTYASEHSLARGMVVTIPVGKKTLTGVVMRAAVEPHFPTKQITSVVESVPLPEPLIATAEWLSDYYRTHLATALQTMLPRGLTKNRRATTKTTPVHKRDRTRNVFTTDQQSALEQIANATPGTILLHGVTGSGKTLVYIEAAKRAIAAGQSVIILVPEIALTSQLVAEFSQHFDDILLTHSKQTESERHQTWRRALLSDTPHVVIGPRSALFMPLRNIGLIVIDECHEPSFKQEQSPRYSALRAASILARNHRAKVILGSATPNITDFYLAKQFHRPIISMPKPARTDTTPPEIAVVDMTQRGNFTRHPFFSNELLTVIESSLAAAQQILIFHNRRGTASTTLCQECGWQSGCPRCFVPLTLHSDLHRLQCHICGMRTPVPTSCPSCGAAEIVHKGIGTKRIETELRKLFPEKVIARFDGDTTTDGGVDARYGELYDGSIDIIIGTQVVAKGLDLPHLRTVGVVQADAGLSLPDFAAPERTFQLLAQVIGRVGRSHHSTRVIVQSYQPDNLAIRAGIAQDYQAFYQRTIQLRRHTHFPPFTHLLKLVCIYKTEAVAIKHTQRVLALLRQHAPETVELLGPTPAFYERVRDTYRWQIIAKSARRQELIELLGHIPATHWQSELDPMSLL